MKQVKKVRLGIARLDAYKCCLLADFSDQEAKETKQRKEN